MTVWPEVEPEHAANVGFVEGAGNRNPWSEEIGAGDAAYCISAACIVPHHHGVQWWPWSQFGAKGAAYCPYFRVAAIRAGVWVDDHASRGAPCDLRPGDVVLYDWNGDGVADHAETVKEVFGLGFSTYGYNVGHPEGCHIVYRDRKYLMGRARLDGTLYVAHAPARIPAPAPKPPPPPKEITVYDIVKADDRTAWYETDWATHRTWVQNPSEANALIVQVVSAGGVIGHDGHNGPRIISEPNLKRRLGALPVIGPDEPVHP